MDPSLLPGKPVSFWLDTQPIPASPILSDFESFDIAIIGGGIVGVTAAFQLRNSGLKVAVLEAGRLLHGVTGQTTGKLTSQHGLVYRTLIDRFGLAKAQLYADANEWAKSWVEATARELEISCDFVSDDALIYTTELKHFQRFDDERDACIDLGLPVDVLERPDLPFETVGAIRMRHQARLHVLKFLVPLRAAAEAAGVRFFERTRVTGVEEIEEQCRIETEHGPILAKRAIVATHYPIVDSGFFVAKLNPFRAYGLAIRTRGPLPEGMYITADEESPTRSIRRHPLGEEDILILVGGGHRVGQGEDTTHCFNDLEHWARLHFDVVEILNRWSTQDIETADGLPYIGLSPGKERTYIATGFNGWGLSNGIVAGKLLADLARDRPNVWAEVFDPGRMEIAAVPKMVSQGIDSIARFVGDRLRRSEDRAVDTLGRGEAALAELDGERVAAFRDSEGQLHLCSPVCTHMGCQVRWNAAEQSWDCPCHGSRFDPDGNVLHAPAVRPLERRGVPAGKSS